MRTVVLRSISAVVIVCAIFMALVATDDASTGNHPAMAVEAVITLALIWAGAACWRLTLPRPGRR